VPLEKIYIALVPVFYGSFSSESLFWLFVVGLDSVHLLFIYISSDIY
jgi:hypothetical protein